MLSVGYDMLVKVSKNPLPSLTLAVIAVSLVSFKVSPWSVSMFELHPHGGAKEYILTFSALFLISCLISIAFTTGLAMKEMDLVSRSAGGRGFLPSGTLLDYVPKGMHFTAQELRILAAVYPPGHSERGETLISDWELLMLHATGVLTEQELPLFQAKITWLSHSRRRAKTGALGLHWFAIGVVVIHSFSAGWSVVSVSLLHLSSSFGRFVPTMCPFGLVPVAGDLAVAAVWEGMPGTAHAW